MRTLIHHRLWSLLFGSGLACGGATNPLFDDTSSDARDVQGFVGDEADPGGSSALKAGTVTALFPGAGTSGAARALSPGLGPETSGDCDPQPAASEPVTGTGVQTVCFFGEDDTTPAAAIEQIVEIVGNDEWVHIRLTLNPDLVDNTYGETAVGWEARAGGPGAGPGAEPKPPKEPREPRAPRAGEAEPPEPPEGAAPPEPPAPPEGAAPPEPPAGGPPPEPPAGAAPPERREPPPDREPRPAPGARAGHTF